MSYTLRCDGCTARSDDDNMPPGWNRLQPINPIVDTDRGGSPIDLITLHLCQVCSLAVRHEVKAAAVHRAPIRCSLKADHPHYDDPEIPS